MAMITENAGWLAGEKLFFCSLFWQRSVRPSIARFHSSRSLTGILLAAASADAQYKCQGGEGKCTSAECDLLDKAVELAKEQAEKDGRKDEWCKNADAGMELTEKQTGCSFSNVRPIMHATFLLLS